MAKGTNAKIKELRGIKPEKITGRMETQKYAMLVAMQKAQGQIDTMRNDFLEKYNSDNINIQTGEIAYPEETTEKTEKDVKINS
jgi:hypothetical protein